METVVPRVETFTQMMSRSEESPSQARLSNLPPKLARSLFKTPAVTVFSVSHLAPSTPVGHSTLSMIDALMF
jgi:hypothetical protein